MITMVSLFSLFVNDRNKPNYDAQRESQKKAWKDALKKNDSYEKQRASQKKAWKDALSGSGSSSSGGSSGSSGSGGSSGSNNGSNGDGSSSGETQEEAEKRAKQEAQKKALASISNMKDSNVSFQYKSDYNDLWNKIALKKQNSAWQLKEEVFLYTFHDKQQHRYLSSITIDSDKSDIMTTCQVSFPYDTRLMEYWIPGKTTFAIVGGTFDRETLFIGRVSEINQRGQEIEMVGQNIGWKFKSYMTKEFEETLQDMTVKNVVKLIFKELGLAKGKYHIDLTGIPNIDDYKVTEDYGIEKAGEDVQNVPELKEVVENIQSYDIDKYVKKKSQTQETQKVADLHDQKKQMSSLNRVVDSDFFYQPSDLRQNYGISTTYKNEQLLYEPILKKIQGSQKLEDYIVQGYSGGGDHTYEEVLTNIAAAIDAHFFIVDTTVCFMSFNALLANSSIIQKAVTPEIDFWQLQEESYILDLNQYGFYNTVKIKYKNGTITRCYDDLVRVFGEVPIEYDESKLDYDSAMLKAQAYLSAHIRDFGMELKATILHTGKITPANFIKLKNPLTMSEGLFFVQGVSVQWSADNQTLVSDLDLRFGPDNPDGLEVPEVGASYSDDGSVTVASGNVSADITKAAQEMIKGCTTNDQKVLAIYGWVDTYVQYEFYWGYKYSSEQVLQVKRANCYDTAYLIYKLCSAVGIKCEVWNGTYHFVDGNYGHLWNKIYYKGEMKFADTARESKNPIGVHGSGRYIVSGSCVAKNY